MQVSKCLVTLGLVSLGLVGCAADTDEDFEYQGDETHFLLEGALYGEDVDYTMDPATAADVESLHCLRLYDPESFAYIETQIIAMVPVGDPERRAEIELKEHDLSATELDSDVEIVARIEPLPWEDDLELASNEATLDWEWHVGDVKTHDDAAVKGTFTLKLFGGTPDAENHGLLEGGSIGGVLDAQWSGAEQVKLSFSAPCVSELDD